VTARVDFYLVNGDRRARDVTVCRIADKAFREGHRVHVLAGGADEAAQIDDLMWTFSDGAFVPHARADQLRPDQEPPPVLISEVEPAGGTNGAVLITLGDAAPDDLQGYARVVEVVDADETARARARARFRVYRDRGLALHTHELGA
jgi:DNA polymerase-3 subunit chi